MLNPLQLKILEAISYDESEPFEYVDGLVLEEKHDASPEETLELIFQLYVSEHVKILQEPIKARGQEREFEKKEIAPSRPSEVVGDLWNDYLAYSKTRNYLSSSIWGDGSTTGVPFGIYIAITDKGQKEVKDF